MSYSKHVISIINLKTYLKNITDDQRHACVEMWMKHNALPSKEFAWQRSKEVCYLITDLNSKDVIGVNTLFKNSLHNKSERYFFNRMLIQPKHRQSRLMITGTAAMLCYAKHYLSEQGAAGIININENIKLNRPGVQRIFNRLGYRHFGWANNQKMLLLDFRQVEYHSR